MVKVSATEFQRNIGLYQDLALTQPVTVTKNRRDHVVLVSADEYRRLKRRDRRAMTLNDFTEEDIAAIEQAKPPRRLIFRLDTKRWRESEKALAQPPKDNPGLRKLLAHKPAWEK